MVLAVKGIEQDATLTQGPPCDAPNIWVPWK